MTNEATNQATVLEALKVADYASRQSDRWLFIAALIIGIVFCVWIGRRLISYIETLNEQSRTDAHEYAQALTNHVNKSNELIPLWTARLAENTKAIEQNTSLIKEFSHTLEQKRRASDQDDRRAL